MARGACLQVVEHGQRVCTVYPHAWGHMVDRAELNAACGTSNAYTVDFACAHCLLARCFWRVLPLHPYPLAWWEAKYRYRAQMLLLAAEGQAASTAAGQYTLCALPMDLADPRLLRGEYDCYPQDEFHNDSCTKGDLINYTLKMLGRGKRGLHAMLEARLANSGRERQDELKHFWTGVKKVTNASHTELNAIWRQIVCDVHLLVSGEDWLAILAWGAVSSWLEQPGPVTPHRLLEFLRLYHFARDALNKSSFNRTTSKECHNKLDNLPWHDVVHGIQRILMWGKGFSTGFFEQMHELVLKRSVNGERGSMGGSGTWQPRMRKSPNCRPSWSRPGLTIPS